jgi:hypothetical protein
LVSRARDATRRDFAASEAGAFAFYTRNKRSMFDHDQTRQARRPM